ncbi:hypothetical protein GWI33_000718 [Rhynchophorus ferrugineus]|uniref:Uncharacterized protein n=1 Tax=Rhynchophorus ferrugineus TaxID=354439 RepID=A0A834IMG9_RHYFE|nr:hypothetical protein GWI33_000718 [Rhynchophorus ferrugineus]
MLGSVAGRHMSRRRGSSPAIKWDDGPPPVSRYARRRRAVTTSDHKSCALIQTRLKLGDIMRPGGIGALSRASHFADPTFGSTRPEHHL